MHAPWTSAWSLVAAPTTDIPMFSSSDLSQTWTLTLHYCKAMESWPFITAQAGDHTMAPGGTVGHSKEATPLYP